MRSIVFTDLDGTLLDGHTYDWSPAREALATLDAAEVPLIFCTSKTKAEVEALRGALDHRHPFIVENGAAVYVPTGYFAHAPATSRRRDDFDVIELGTPYIALVAALKEAARSSAVPIRGWHEMGAEEVAERCEMPVETARLAMRREYDEPFLVADEQPERVARLALAIAAIGARMTRGNRFFHITGTHDKAAAAGQLIARYRQVFGSVRVVALGDAPNDAGMLALADIAVLVSSPYAAAVQARVPAARITSEPGPVGWNAAILDIFGSATASRRP